VYIIEGNLWIKFQFFHLEKLSIKYELSNLMFYVMFKWSMVLKKLFTQQVEWFGDKGIPTMGCKDQIYKWHLLWSTLECQLNILYLPKLPRLGGYLSRPM